MAGKNYKLNFELSDGTTKSVQFTAPQGEKGDTGEKGDRGTGILKITAAPSSYTTAIGSYTPKYRIATATVISQSGVSEVKVGDILQYSYYQYAVDHLDSTYAYISKTRTSIRGADGVGIASIEQTTTSSADGGSNVFTVTLDDGATATFTVKNGSKGSTGASGSNGADGKSAYIYALEAGYQGSELEFAEHLAKGVPEISQNTGDSETAVMSQAAVTAALKTITALPYGGSKEWLENNGDTSKLYQIDGYVWGYIESTGWTRSGTQYLLVSSESEMTNEGGTEYLLRNGDSGTVYEYTPASGDTDVTVVDSVPETANDGDIITVSPTEVSSIDEMTDTSKQYAMGGKVWKYDEVEVEKVPENVFVPANATLNKRLSSSGESSSNGMFITEYLEFDASTATSSIIWLPTDWASTAENQRVLLADANKAKLSSYYIKSNMSSSHHYVGRENGRYYVDISKDNTGSTMACYASTKYIRIGLSSGVTTSITAADIADVEILFEKDRGVTTQSQWVETDFSVGRKYQATVSGSEVTWTDVGTYVEPTAASWDATEETHTIIDSLSVTANSGDSAVYSGDGYQYAYISGSAWMATAKYEAPTLAIDGELSDTSANAVQNRVVKAAVDSVKTMAQTNATEIAAMNQKIASLESGTETLTVPSFWQDAVDEAISKIKALQVGRNCITFPFFSDNHQRNGYAGVLIAYIMQACHIPYCFFGGDSISNGTIADEATMIAQDKAFDSIMSYIPNGRFCRAVGNHDGYWYDGTNKYYYTREQVYELFLREEAIAQNKHFGDDGTYYYVDDIASKVRWIILNTNGGSVDSTQIAWVQNTALNFTESGWAVVFISHQPISNHYHALISNAAEVRETVVSSGAEIIGWFSGHIHRDRIYTGAATNTSDDTEGDAMGFTQVTITSDHTGIAYDDATKHTVAADDQSHAIDFVTINRATRTVNITRLGIGEDRSFSY